MWLWFLTAATPASVSCRNAPHSISAPVRNCSVHGFRGNEPVKDRRCLPARIGGFEFCENAADERGSRRDFRFAERSDVGCRRGCRVGNDRLHGGDFEMKKAAGDPSALYVFRPL